MGVSERPKGSLEYQRRFKGIPAFFQAISRGFWCILEISAGSMESPGRRKAFQGESLGNLKGCRRLFGKPQVYRGYHEDSLMFQGVLGDFKRYQRRLKGINELQGGS